MHDVLTLAVGWSLGVVLCGVMAGVLTVRLGLPWRAALMYFGVLAYPEELRPRPRARRVTPKRRG